VTARESSRLAGLPLPEARCRGCAFEASAAQCRGSSMSYLTVTVPLTLVEPDILARIVTFPFPGALARVSTVNCAELVPALTVTVAGTVATAVSLLCRVTTTPPAGATAESVTVPVELSGWVTTSGLKDSPDNVGKIIPTGGFTVSTADAEPLRVAVNLAVVAPATANVVIGKVAVLAPATTATDGGATAAEVLLLLRATEMPPAGAGPFSVTVPVELAEPPTTVDGLSDTDRIPGGSMVN
jgi:hypothetical protein